MNSSHDMKLLETRRIWFWEASRQHWFCMQLLLYFDLTFTMSYAKEGSGNEILGEQALQFCPHWFAVFCMATLRVIKAHCVVLGVRSIKITFGSCRFRNTVKIDGALLWYLKNFFEHFTWPNYLSLGYNLMVINTNGFFCINCTLLLLLSLACKNIDWDGVARQVQILQKFELILDFKLI